MAVDQTFQRKGVGSEIVYKLEDHASTEGEFIVLNAREKAISFYKSLGYEELGPYISDTGIPHKTMRKSLNIKEVVQ